MELTKTKPSTAIVVAKASEYYLRLLPLKKDIRPASLRGPEPGQPVRAPRRLRRASMFSPSTPAEKAIAV
jgi:hypothetical protein